MPSRICRHSRPPSMGLIQLGRKIAGFISTQISKNMRFMFIQQMFIQSPSETPNKKTLHPIQSRNIRSVTHQNNSKHHPIPIPIRNPSHQLSQATHQHLRLAHHRHGRRPRRRRHRPSCLLSVLTWVNKPRPFTAVQ